MSRAASAIRGATRAPIFVAVAALSLALPLLEGEAGASLQSASPWVELPNARVRLLAGPPAAEGAKSYLAGVELMLGEGWKTYWRTPGDAGVPPSFDWAGSVNLDRAEVLYPAPVRMHEPAAETIGYRNSVVFPVEVLPADAGKSVELHLTVAFGICRDICIPAEASLTLPLYLEQMRGAPSPAMLAALQRVPRRAALRRASDPELKGVTARLEGAAPSLLIEARFAQGSTAVDLFLEAAEETYVPLPKRLPDGPDGTARFAIDLSHSDNAKQLKGKTLKLTLTSEVGASEAAWTLP